MNEYITQFLIIYYVKNAILIRKYSYFPSLVGKPRLEHRESKYLFVLLEPFRKKIFIVFCELIALKHRNSQSAYLFISLSAETVHLK